MGMRCEKGERLVRSGEEPETDFKARRIRQVVGIIIEVAVSLGLTA